MKRCSECGKLKNEDSFPKDKTRKDGLHQRCKECKNKYNRKRYKTSQSMKEKIAEEEVLKSCSRCGELKSVSEFSRDRTKKDGYYHLCKVCRSTYRRKGKMAGTALEEGSLKNETKKSAARGVNVLAIVYTGDDYVECSLCGKGLVGYVPGYLHGQPVCKECIVINLKTMFIKKQILA
ncbi:hypothetical protein PITCH_A980010 [uncultured Desulfobacterium sp.]|uniref:Stc1 domain-containing protein n=1 Tax=uncultured Desulfobacterium sp. TaxID=201089 RepID=A0A445N486_9BACT|nr:hypothetical protein PITCH_A980010 [uncultured Desulfobacterium sp.]